MVGVGRRGPGEFFGEVVFVSVSEGGGSVGEGVFEFIILIASGCGESYSMVLRLRKRGCLGKEWSILEDELLVGALHISLQLEMVIDMLLLFDY